MRDNPWPSLPRGLQQARRSLRALVVNVKTPSASTATVTARPASPASTTGATAAPPRSQSLSRLPPATPTSPPRRPPPASTGPLPAPSKRPPPASPPAMLPPQRPARRLPVVHSANDYPEHLNPFREDADDDAAASAPPCPPDYDEPELRPTQDKFGTWTVPRRRSHLNFGETW